MGSYGQDAKVQEMGEAGLLGPDTTYIHCTTLNDTEIQMIVDTGGTVSLASPVEMMMGHGMPRSRSSSIAVSVPSLSVDVETNVPSDMFNQMRSVLALQRATATAQGKAPLATTEVLACATIEGAQGERTRREGGDADARQASGPHHAAHRSDQRHAAERRGDRGRRRDGYRATSTRS